MAIRDNNRDVELAISTTVGGIENVQQLRQAVLELAKQGGAAAPEFRRLADEIGRLGEQDASLQTFSKIAADVSELSTVQGTAAAKSRDLGDALKALSAETERFRTIEEKSRDALKSAQSDLTGQRDALTRLKLETDDAGKKTEDYRNQVRKLNTDILDSKIGIRALADEHRAAAAATKIAAEAEAGLATQQKAANRDLRESAAALDARKGALDASRSSLEAAGVATNELAAAQEKLLSAYSGAQDSVRSFIQSQKEAADAAKAAVAEEDRLDRIIARTRSEQAAAAKVQLAAELEAADRTEQAHRKAAEAATAAGKAIHDALGVVGVRGAKEIEAEIEKVRAALNTIKTSGALAGEELNRAFSLGEAKIKGLQRELRDATGQLTLMDRAAGAFRNTAVQLFTGFGVVEGLQRLASGFLDTTKQIEGLRLGLTTVYGSAQIAAQQIDFLRKTADAAGVSFGSISEAFVKFSAASQSASIPLQATNDLFEALTRAAATLGLSGDKVSLMLEALGQMASKGTVQLEELKGQLGDSLPGALSLVSKGLGITTQELFKLVESGGLLYRDLVPALTNSLKTMGGEVDTLNSRWERFKNLLTVIATTAGDQGWTDILKAGLTAVAVPLGLLVTGFSALFETIFTGARVAGVSLAALAEAARGNLSGLKGLGEEVDRITDAAIARQAKQIEAFGKVLGATEEIIPAQQAATAATLEGARAAETSAGAHTAAAGAVAQNAAAHATAAGATKDAARALLDSAIAVEVAGVKIGNVGDGFVKVGVEAAKAEEIFKLKIETLGKVVKAYELEGQSIEAITKLSGSERDALLASVSVAQGTAKALADLSATRNAEVEALRVQLATMVELAKHESDPDGVRQKAIDDLKASIDLKKAEAQQTAAQVDAIKTEVAARSLAVKSYEDNAAAVGKLKDARDAANNTLKAMVILEEAGKVTHERVTDATRAAAAAEGLYRDALADSADAMKRNIEALQNKNLILQGGLKIELERARTAEAEALANRDEYSATQAKIEQKKIEIRIVEATVAALQAEAKQEIALAEAKRAALVESGELTANRVAEIDKTIASAKAKQLEASATQETVKQIKSEIDVLNQGTHARNTHTQSIEDGTSARERSIAAQEKEIQLSERELALSERKRQSRDLAGNVVAQEVPTYLSIVSQLKGLGVADAQALKIAREFTDTQGNVPYFNNPGQKQYGQFGDTLSAAAARAASNLLFNSASGASAVPGAAFGTTEPAARPITPPPAPAYTTVNINLEGRRTQIRVAGPGDANALTDVLRQLGEAAGTAA